MDFTFPELLQEGVVGRKDGRDYGSYEVYIYMR